MRKSKALLSMMILAIVCTMTGVNVFAAETFDAVTAMTDAGESISTQILSILGVLAPIVVGILGARIAFTKGIGMFKSLIGKG